MSAGDLAPEGSKMRDLIRTTINRLKDKADYLEARIQQSEKTSIYFKGHELEALSSGAELGGCVRALYKGGWGFATFNDLAEIEKYANAAIDQARKTGSSKSILAEVDLVEDEVMAEARKDPRSVSVDEKLKLMKSYNDLILGYSPKITSSSVRYFDRFHRIWFGNSEGTNIMQEKLDLGGACTAIAADENTTQMQWALFGSSDDFSAAEDLENQIRRACDDVLSQLAAPKIRSGRYTVIADPRLSGVFVHEAFGHLSEGDNVYENEKLRKIMTIGSRFGGEMLSIYDTGLTKGSRGYLKYDDEGVPTEKTYLVRNGELVGRLHSRETAGKLGEKPTGSARAIDYRHPPICRMRDTRIEAGNDALEDMLDGIEEGVYVVDAKGGETAVELFTFSAGRAYMIRNGRISEMVRDATISGNLFTTLKNIDAIAGDQEQHDGPGGCGKDGQFPLPVSDGGPHIRILDCVIGGE
jgi:TldD protein